MSVTYLWVGATTDDSVVVKAKVSSKSKSARLHVSTSKSLSAATTSDKVDVKEGVAALSLDGLDADTHYYYGVEVDGKLDEDTAGRFRTHPPLGKPAKFSVASASCAGLEPEHPGEGKVVDAQRISNHPVFTTIRDSDPLMFLHMGDMHYYNIGSGSIVDDHDAATYRRAIDDVFKQSHQATLYRDVATQYVWDDHDFGPNDSDSSAPGRKAACQVYRERVPHYELSDDLGIWHSWTIGRVLFVALDVRTYRAANDDPADPGKSMLGDAQKSWLRRVLKAPNAAYLVVMSITRWFDESATDSWNSFTDERDEMIELFESTGWKDRMCLLAGDVHAVAMDSGGNSPGGIPVFQFAALDSAYGEPQDHYDQGPSKPGRAQYGVLSFDDTGDEVKLTATAFRGEEEIMSHSLTAEVPERLRAKAKKRKAKKGKASGGSWWSNLTGAVKKAFGG